MTKLRFLFRGLVIFEATILIVVFAARSDLVLRISYGLSYMNARLNAANFHLTNNSNEVKKLFTSLNY